MYLPFNVSDQSEMSQIAIIWFAKAEVLMP